MNELFSFAPEAFRNLRGKKRQNNHLILNYLSFTIVYVNLKRQAHNTTELERTQPAL